MRNKQTKGYFCLAKTRWLWGGYCVVYNWGLLRGLLGWSVGGKCVDICLIAVIWVLFTIWGYRGCYCSGLGVIAGVFGGRGTAVFTMGGY